MLFTIPPNGTGHLCCSNPRLTFWTIPGPPNGTGHLCCSNPGLTSRAVLARTGLVISVALTQD